MAHDVHVDPDARVTDDLPDHGAARDALPARPAARTHDDLGRVERACSLEERRADVAPGDLVVAPSELLDQLVLALEELGRRCREPVLRDDVNPDELALGPLRYPRGSADQRIPVGRAGQRDDDSLARLPRLVDVVAVAVLLERLVHPIADPRERELAESRQVSGPEEVGERGVDALGLVHVAPCEPVAESDGSEIHELDLVSAASDLVRDRLALLDTRDLLDDVVQRLQVLDVHRRDDRDARCHELLDVLPSLLVPRAGDVRVRQLVHERDVGLASEDGVHVHLLEGAVAVGDPSPRNHLEVGDLGGGLRSSVRLDETHDDVLAVVAPAAALVEHGERLSDSCRGSQVEPELSALHGHSLPYARSASSARFSSRTFTAGSPRKPRPRPAVCSSTSRSTLRSGIPVSARLAGPAASRSRG